MSYDIHLKFAGLDYECPYCECKNYDSKEVVSKRIDKNKKSYTKVVCWNCESDYFVTCNYMGNLQAFKPS